MIIDGMIIRDQERRELLARRQSLQTVDDTHAMNCGVEILSDIAGGTFEEGVTFADKLIYKINNGIPFTHSMIVYGEKFNERGAGKPNIRAQNTPFNIALVKRFEIDSNPHDVVGNSVVWLGSVGLNAEMENVWDPDATYENGGLSDDERDGLRRHLYDVEGNVIPGTGVTFMPKVALRAVLQDR